jgi:hypothetical protein
VGSAVNVRIVEAVILVHRLNDPLGLLDCGAVVEVRERLPFYLAGKDRELGPD